MSTTFYAWGENNRTDLNGSYNNHYSSGFGNGEVISATNTNAALRVASMLGAGVVNTVFDIQGVTTTLNAESALSDLITALKTTILGKTFSTSITANGANLPTETAVINYLSTRLNYYVTKASVINEAVTLQWGQSNTIGSIGGTSITVTMPSAPQAIDVENRVSAMETKWNNLKFNNVNTGYSDVSFNNTALEMGLYSFILKRSSDNARYEVIMNLQVLEDHHSPILDNSGSYTALNLLITPEINSETHLPTSKFLVALRNGTTSISTAGYTLNAKKLNISYT